MDCGSDLALVRAVFIVNFLRSGPNKITLNPACPPCGGVRFTPPGIVLQGFGKT
ncbi:hypothetical protein RSSM_00608 [Rhodopirellula sallentina SM41]|uniref:Uncharacterized protein n=1 Tax=Rhodopirellula sallentina SM41 TaxID=1263870 RepID=M5UPN3_9BACT|nr:hypothetical protein RSSM_00608 [Rhodopirellula sallentina SM41]